jgi:hypothetical protein
MTRARAKNATRTHLERVLHCSGEALPTEAQLALGQVFDHDLSRIRIHADTQANRAADAFDARAFAFGQHIAFADGEYAPHTSSGWQTLMHEIAHTAQQRHASETLPREPLPMSTPTHEAEARAVTSGAASSTALTPSSASVARLQPDEGEGLDGDASHLNRAALLEQAAHRLAYEHYAEVADEDGNRHWEWTPDHTVTAAPGTPEFLEETRAAALERQQHEYAMEMMRRAGYDADSSHSVEGANGFGMRSFLPLTGRDGEALSPIVAFRGTETSAGRLTDDLIGSDTNPEGIGADQFTLNRDLIRSEMTAAARTGSGALTLSGHSLGGALAQRAGAEFSDLVGDITTFQSPGVTSDVSERVAAVNADREARGLEPISSTHFRASDMDIVPWAGDALTPGTVETFDPTGVNTLLDHMAFPLTNRALARGEGLAKLTGDAQLGGLSQLQGSDFSSNPSLVQSTDEAGAEGIGLSEAARRAAGSFVWDPLRAGMTLSGGLLGGIGLNAVLPDGNLTSQAMEGAVSGVSSLWNLATGAANAGANGVETGISRGWNGLGNAAGNAADRVHAGVSSLWGGLNDIGGAAADTLESGARDLRGAVGDYVPDIVMDGASGGWNLARGAIGETSDFIGDSANAVYGGARDLVSGAAGGVGDTARGLWRAGRGAVSGAASAVEGVGSGMADSVLEAAQHIREHPIAVDAYNALSSGASSLASTASGAVDTAAGAASSAWQWMTDW